jgi:aspartate-semialdehyde dehydrogenase
VLGATGVVGQKLVARLERHPWFELAAVAASERSAGRCYGETVRWRESTPIPAAAAELEILAVDRELEVDLVLSALDAATASAVEPLHAARLPVVTNASAHRMDPTVPLVVPEVNPGHLELARRQRFGGGFIVANPNCAAIGLALALAPLVAAFGVEEVLVTTLQAASGAGSPGVPSLDLLGNVIPWIAGEEEKLEREPRKIFGRLLAGALREAPLRIAAQVHRVPVVDGHLLAIAARLSRPAELAEVAAAIDGFGDPLAALGLPSSPGAVLIRGREEEFPQPRLHAGLGAGMSVAVGRLRRSPVLDLRCEALVNNLVRGAAGGTLLVAELVASRGLLAARRVRRRPCALLCCAALVRHADPEVAVPVRCARPRGPRRRGGGGRSRGPDAAHRPGKAER